MTNITSNPINFKAKISPRVQKQLERQIKYCDSKNRTKQIFDTQLKNIQNWGSSDSEVIICKNQLGKYCLGLKMPVSAQLSLFWFFEHLSGKTELSQFIRLHHEHIESTEKTIKFMYSKYGIDIFKKLL